MRLGDGQVGGRLVQASSGEVTPRAHQGKSGNGGTGAMRAALPKQDDEPMRLARTVCPGAPSPARVAVEDRFCGAPVARITVIR